jgi:hypothetical protein
MAKYNNSMSPIHDQIFVEGCFCKKTRGEMRRKIKRDKIYYACFKKLCWG